MNTQALFCLSLPLVIAGCAQQTSTSTARDSAFAQSLRPPAFSDTRFYRVRSSGGGIFKAGTPLPGRCGGGYLTPLRRCGWYLAVCGNGFTDTHGAAGRDDTYRYAADVRFFAATGGDGCGQWVVAPAVYCCLSV